MAYFFFTDESGTDRRDSYYEVLCAVAIEDADLWNLITRLKSLEEQILGTRYANQWREIKGKKFLKAKVFKLASTYPALDATKRANLARLCIEDGAKANREQMAALSQAKLEYVRQMLEICMQFRIRIFASITADIIRETDEDGTEFLRRDYVYAFERMFYYLDDKGRDDQGIIVFDELEKSKSHILVSQIENYFKRTLKGRQRAGMIIPEPFFVHSDLTTGIQIADIIAYIISWGFRLNGMDKPSRPELAEFVELIKPLRYRTKREVFDGEDRDVWSVIYVK